MELINVVLQKEYYYFLILHINLIHYNFVCGGNTLRILGHRFKHIQNHLEENIQKQN